MVENTVTEISLDSPQKNDPGGQTPLMLIFQRRNKLGHDIASLWRSPIHQRLPLLHHKWTTGEIRHGMSSVELESKVGKLNQTCQEVDLWNKFERVYAASDPFFQDL